MPEQPLPPELVPLVQVWLEGSLTPQEAARLDAALASQPALAESLLTELRTDAMLRESCGATKSHTVPDQPSVASLAPIPSPVSISAPVPAAIVRGVFPRHRLAAWLAVAAAIMLLAVPFIRFQLVPPASVGTFSGEVVIERNGAELPASLGVELRPGDTLHTRADARAEIMFRGERTRLALEPRTRLAVRQLDRGKSFELRHGTINADIGPHGADQPVSFVTSRASATVRGTRFALAARYGATWLRVDEGLVDISNITSDEPTTVVVGAGQFAVAAPDVVLQPRPAAGALETLSAPLQIDFEEGMSTGFGNWEPIPGGIRPTELARFPDARQLGDGWIDPAKPKPYSFYFLPVTARGSFRLSALIDVETATPDLAAEGNLNLWRFGFGLRYPHREISLRINQRPDGGLLQTRVLKPEWRRFLPQSMDGRSEAPFTVTPGGSYRLTWEIRRQSPSKVRLQGKIWPADSAEPTAWTVDTVVENVEGDLGAVNLDTYRAICAFRDFKAELLP